MTIKVNFTKPGMGIEEGTVLRWLKGVGESVREGEPIAEVETAKAVEEILAPVNGTLTQILAPVGHPAAINTDLAVIEEDHV
jgi:pyruvate/2-oxoglutarate dehydrogenase complex dihydrolipoamide acyltransferase (E2) component